jgi:hypothetical protein
VAVVLVMTWVEQVVLVVLEHLQEHLVVEHQQKQNLHYIIQLHILLQ